MVLLQHLLVFQEEQTFRLVINLSASIECKDKLYQKWYVGLKRRYTFYFFIYLKQGVFIVSVVKLNRLKYGFKTILLLQYDKKATQNSVSISKLDLRWGLKGLVPHKLFWYEHQRCEYSKEGACLCYYFDHFF